MCGAVWGIPTSLGSSVKTALSFWVTEMPVIGLLAASESRRRGLGVGGEDCALPHKSLQTRPACRARLVRPSWDGREGTAMEVFQLQDAVMD